MQIPVDDELRAICAEIVAEGHDADEWAEIESSDMFQSAHYCGGYEADEEAFTFSHYDEAGRERWFNVTLAQAKEIADGRLTVVEARDPS